MADPRLDVQHQERERQVRQVVSVLKSIADATEGQSPARAIEKATAKFVAHRLRDKQASRERPDAIAAAARMERRFGVGWVDLEPQTLHEAGFDEHDITAAFAAKLTLYGHAPFEEWQVFEKVALALTGRTPDFTLPQEPSLVELAWAVDAMRYLDPVTPFSAEVAAYIATAAIRDGFVRLPHALGFAGPYLERRMSDHGRQVATELERSADTEAARVQADKLAHLNDCVNSRHAKLLAELRELVR